MSRKLRFLRLISIVLAVLVFGGYFGFVTFLYNPLEKDLALDVSVLVPRNVDYFLARSNLEQVFDPFPKLADAEILGELPAWKTFRDSPEYSELDAQYGIQQSLEQIESSLARLPGEWNLVRVFGADDLAVAGFFKPGGLERASWAVYGRVNWAGKLAYSMLSYPGLIGLEKQGLSAEENEGVLTLSGGQLATALHLGRVRDVVIVANDPDLLTQSLQSAAEGGTDSLFNSARYNDHISIVTRSSKRDEIELYCDVRKLLESLALPGPLPDTSSENLGVALLGRLFQLPAFKEVAGVLSIREGIDLRLHVEFSSEQISRFQERFYRLRGATRDEILNAASFAPSDTAYFAMARVPIGEFLTELLASAEPALRNNIDDLFRNSKRYSGIDEVVRVLDAGLGDQFSIIMRENDYAPERKLDEATGEEVYVGPPHDGQPVFAVSLVNQIRDVPKIEQFRSNLRDMDKELGLQGQTPGSRGVFQYGSHGYTTFEFWQPLVRGTGVISSLFDNQISVSSNTIPMPVQVMQTTAVGAPRYPRLTDRSEFKVLLDQLLEGDSANFVFWCDPARAVPTLRAMAEVWARDQAAAGIDWERLRAREETRLLEQLFSGKSRSALSQQDAELLDSEIDAALRDLRESEAQARFPQLMAAKERELSYWLAVRGIVATIRLEERKMKVGLRVLVPLPTQEQ